ncbi:uncharacterized protein [Miscanthus floridulus]|uniref:uncharacterized protein n=1 Tax=Miscanthus floridulus TaxID=154761 RepID=UPI003458FF81
MGIIEVVQDGTNVAPGYNAFRVRVYIDAGNASGPVLQDLSALLLIFLDYCIDQLHSFQGFFFSSKTEKKLSFELSVLKTELDLCRAKMEAERQTHQKEEQALHARVVETEKQRDAAIQEASKNSEAMKNLETVKKECNALWVKKQKLSEGVDEMKTLSAATPLRIKKAKHRPSHAHLAPALDVPTGTHNASPLKDNMGEAQPIVLTSPPTPPTPSSKSDLEVNLEDDPNQETASEEEPKPLPVEEVVFKSLETARKEEEEDRHLRAIAQKETDDCILKRVVEISKEDERRHEEEECHS